MTPPEKEFVPGTYVNYHGERAWYCGPALDEGCMLQTATGPTVVSRQSITEWNPDPKPKSFEGEREALAKIVENAPADGIDFIKTSARSRAPQPDATAAAVAGSAEPAGWRALIDGDYEYFETLEAASKRAKRFAEAYFEVQNEGCAVAVPEPFYLVPPSPPPPNLVGREWDGIPLMKISVSSAYDGKNQVERRELINWFAMPIGEYMLYTTPPAVSVAFDEAAERKLFEAAHPDLDLAWNDWVEFYFIVQTDRLWKSWLASAKVQRGAVPAVVAEIRRKVLQVAEIAPLTSIHDIVRKLRYLADKIADGSIAAKLGGSNE